MPSVIEWEEVFFFFLPFFLRLSELLEWLQACRQTAASKNRKRRKKNVGVKSSKNKQQKTKQINSNNNKNKDNNNESIKSCYWEEGENTWKLRKCRWVEIEVMSPDRFIKFRNKNKMIWGYEKKKRERTKEERPTRKKKCY